MANSVGVGGLLGFLSFNADVWWKFGLISLVAIVVPLVLTYGVGKKRK